MIHLNPNDRKKLEGFVQEISNAMLRMDAERDLIREICNKAKDDLQMKPKTVRQMGRLHYKNSLLEEKLETNELFDTYEQLFS